MVCPSDHSSNQAPNVSPREILRRIFVQAVKSLYPDMPENIVSLTPANAKFGDYQCNAPLPICQQLKASGKKQNYLDELVYCFMNKNFSNPLIFCRSFYNSSNCRPEYIEYI